ncbi:hypothetical protein PInf_003711 [Phytophthora infestans]|nr:hypothetical protein PInf_003711 [Phytophthora infestans]
MTVTGTVEYMAPEMIDSRTGIAAYAEAADVYSLAITFWDILYPHREKYPDTSNNHFLIFESVLKGSRPPIEDDEPINEDVPSRLLELITSAWRSDPRTRPTAQQVVKELENIQETLLATLAQDILSENGGVVETSVNMFTGEYAVERMEQLQVIESRSEGIRLGRALMDAGFLHHFEHSCGFQDSNTSYYFLDDDNINFCQPLAILEESVRDSDYAPRSPQSSRLQSPTTKLRMRSRLLSHLTSTFSRSVSDADSRSGRNSMALSFLDEKTRDLMSASYAIPDLETAVKQVIYNSIDAQAKTITLFVDVTNASFTAVDDGQGIQPDDLHEYIGECYATSRAPVSKCSRREEKPHKKYGSRGAFLQELTTLAAHVEIESRVKEHWTSYRKVFKEGSVVFNARSKELRKTAGTKVSVSNLFGKLPVRRKDLTRNRKYRSRVVQNTHNFCVSMSMIWPSLSFDIRYEGEDVRPVKIPAATSCRERFLGHFGQLLGKDLQYVDFSSKAFLFSIRGYFAFVPCALGGLGQGIKQAKSYYQFALLENEYT